MYKQYLLKTIISQFKLRSNQITHKQTATSVYMTTAPLVETAQVLSALTVAGTVMTLILLTVISLTH